VAYRQRSNHEQKGTAVPLPPVGVPVRGCPCAYFFILLHKPEHHKRRVPSLTSSVRDTLDCETLPAVSEDLHRDFRSGISLRYRLRRPPVCRHALIGYPLRDEWHTSPTVDVGAPSLVI